MERKLKFNMEDSLLDLKVMRKRKRLTALLVAGVVTMAILIGAGCTVTNPFDKKPIRLHNPTTDTNHKYYVIDANADTPDAFFETYDEASTYQKDFADHHEYVIVKIDEKYNVYNMEPIKNDTQAVQKSQ